MHNLLTLAGSGIWFFLMLSALGLLTGACFVLIWNIRHAGGRKAFCFSALNLLLSFFIYFCMLYITWVLDYGIRGETGFFRVLPFAPWTVYTALEAVSFVILLLCIWGSVRFFRNHVTPDAIRETVNLFPEGLSVSEEDGTVVLTNLTMDGLSRSLLGEPLTDAERFWKAVSESGEEQNGAFLLRAADGSVWLFAKEELNESGRLYHQITASEVTERYRIIDELRENNTRLQDIQQRMKAVSELSADMFVAQESAAARAALHNQLGQVLLMGSYFLEHPESADAGMVYMTTVQMNSFLLGEAQRPEEESGDAVKEAAAAARRIGVSVQIEGTVPPNPAFQTLLGLAVTECTANAVKHADGTILYVTVSETPDLTAVLTNNGRPPKGPVEESGGLLALRRKTEAAGGRMTVDSQPAFRLKIELPVS